MYPNPMKQKIQNGELILGTSYPVPHPILAGFMSAMNADFAWLDTEHAPHGTESLGAIPVLLRQQGVAPLIRVPWNDPGLIKKAYDVGAVAVMIPQIETVEEAEQAVQYAKYPPEGNRGVSPNWPRIAGEDWNHVIKTANEETVLILQIESVKAYENLDDMKKVAGVDAFFLGPTDMSASVGKITEINSPEVQEIIQGMPQKLQGTGIASASLSSDLADMQKKIDWGYTILSVGNLMAYGAQMVKEQIDTLRQG